jgi:Uma2 family endonuclease
VLRTRTRAALVAFRNEDGTVLAALGVVVLAFEDMVMLAPFAHPSTEPAKRPAKHLYLRAPEPVYFPASEEMPETTWHLEIRTALYLILKREFAATATIGSEQFVYWDPTTAKKCLAPDAFVRLSAPHKPFRTWKTWERGAPDLGVEIVSLSDEDEDDWDEKLARYRMAGIGEVVRFHAEAPNAKIRIWDLLDGDIVERAPNDPDLLACECLGLWWTVVEHPSLGPMLRLARDRAGQDLLPTPDDEAIKAREAEASARKAEASAREDNARLEAELSALKAQLEGTGKKTRKRGANPKR